MHLLYPKFEISRKTPATITVEVSNGRSIGLAAPILIGLAVSVWLAIGVTVLCMVVWSYKREWVFDMTIQKASSLSRVFNYQFNQIAYAFEEFSGLYIIKVSDGPDAGHAYCLQLGLRDGASSAMLAKTNKRQELVDLAASLKPYLPQRMKFQLEVDTDEENVDRAA